MHTTKRVNGDWVVLSPDSVAIVTMSLDCNKNKFHFISLFQFVFEGEGVAASIFLKNQYTQMSSIHVVYTLE